MSEFVATWYNCPDITRVGHILEKSFERRPTTLKNRGSPPLGFSYVHRSSELAIPDQTHFQGFCPGTFLTENRQKSTCLEGSRFPATLRATHFTNLVFIDISSLCSSSSSSISNRFNGKLLGLMATAASQIVNARLQPFGPGIKMHRRQ